MIIRSIFLYLVSIVRPNFKLDNDIPIMYLMSISLDLLIDLMRGVLRTRRAIALGAGTRIRCLKKFKSHGGLIRISNGCYIDCMSKNGVTIGKAFKLGAHSRLIATGSLQNVGLGIVIGDNVGLSEYTYIGGAGGTSIGANTIAGQYLSVHPENHIISALDKKILLQGVSRKGVHIGEDCWIGAKVTILDGVTIGDHCVIAAGSVVNSSFPSGVVIGGVPAKIIRAR